MCRLLFLYPYYGETGDGDAELDSICNKKGNIRSSDGQILQGGFSTMK